MIVRIVPIVPVVSKNVQAIGTIIWKHFPDDRRRSQTTRTIGTIAHDRGDREKSEAIKWKHSQTIGTIGTIEVYPRKHHSRHHSVVGPRNFADDRELPLFWDDRGDHLETSDRPNRPDRLNRLKNFWKRLGRSRRSGRSYGNQALVRIFWQKFTRNRDLETREKCKNWQKNGLIFRIFDPKSVNFG